MPMQNETLRWLRLIRSEGVGPTTFDKLLREFDTVERVLAAMPSLRSRGKPLLPANEKDIEKEYNALLKLGGQFILKDSPDYAENLRHIADAPPVLSAIGNIGLLQKPMLAIVGARNASVNGRKLAATLARDLAAAGFVIVSGLARGIDTAEDVLQAFSVFPSRSMETALLALDEEPELPLPNGPSMTDDQSRHAVLSCLSQTACLIDDIVLTSQVPVQRVLSILMEMELTGQVQRLSGNRVVRL